MVFSIDDLPARMLDLDEEAVRAFAQEFGGRLRRLFCSLGLGVADAEALAVSCVTDIALRVDRFAPQGPGSFERWVLKLARVALVDEYRKHDPAEQLPDWSVVERAEVSWGKPDSRRTVAVREAVARLPDLDRDIVRLRHLEQGLSFAEIGAVLNLSEGAARTRHHRALAELERLLSGHPALVRRAVARDPLTE